MSYLGLYAWSFGVTLGAVVSPGPVSAAIVTESARRGWRVGPLVATGHALTEVVMVVVLALGIGEVLKHPALAAAVGILGGAFLLWMGGTMAWAAARRKLRLAQVNGNPEAGESRSLIALGIATTLSNPFWYVWWVGVGGGYVLMTHQQGLPSLAAFFLGHISADYAWDTLLASVVGSGRRWLTDILYQVLVLICGLFLIYTGLRFIGAGISLGAG